MSVEVQTTQETADSIVAGVEAETGQDVPLLAKAFTRVLAWVFAGVYAILFRYGSWIALQLFVRYASTEPVTLLGKRFIPAEEWGKLRGVGVRDKAVRTDLMVAVTVLNQSGDLANGAMLTRPETGVVYQVLAPVPLNAPTVQARVRAVSDQQGGDGAGTIGNAPDGAVLEFAKAEPNVGREVTVVSTVVQGSDAQDPEEYRNEVIAAFQVVPQGGAYADYHVWAKSVPGIINAYPYAGDPGEIDVYVEASVASSGSADGIPTGAQITAVETAINEPDRRPVSDGVNVLAITRQAYALTVTGLSPDNATMRGKIEGAADEHLRTLEPYIEGLSVLPRKDLVTQADLGSVVQAVVSGEGGTVASITLTGGPSQTLAAGTKAKLGVVTYV